MTINQPITDEGQTPRNQFCVGCLQSLFPAIATTLGGHAGVKVFTQYNQFYKTGRFGYYDYGEQNLEVYGRETPPDYQIGKITAPVCTYFAENDALVSPKVPSNSVMVPTGVTVKILGL